MIIYDFEVFKYDWLICWLDTETRKLYNIVNDKAKFKKFYEHYKNTLWVGYNTRNYDVWIAKALLCDFNPYDMSTWIIEKGKKGFEFSRLLNKFPILNYDCSVGFRSLKELEAFMGHDIRETSVPFDIDRPLTKSEIAKTIYYCNHDVMEAFEVFVETKEEFESHVGLIKEFNLDISNMNKTKAQLSAIILGAEYKEHNDEFEISLPDNLQLGKYKWIEDYFYNWTKNVRDYDKLSLEATICDVPHTFGIGGIHGAINNYVGEGYYIMADVGSYYPASMIEYNYLSRNVRDKEKFRKIRDERIVMKRNKDKRQAPRKIVLNSTFGASKDKFNKLYDPLQANNLCIANQLFLVDLLEKLEGKCQLIQSNTDGVLIKLYKKEDKDMIIEICEEWCKRTRFELEYDEYERVYQKDVNNYIIIPHGDLFDSKGKELFKRKGAVVKKLNPLDNDLPIVNKAIVNYILYHTPIKETINNATQLIDFQKISKITNKYDYAVHNGEILHERVHRCFASKNYNDTTLYKKHKSKTTYDKVANVPDHCFIINDNVLDKPVPSNLDKQWYINVAEERLSKFI